MKHLNPFFAIFIFLLLALLVSACQPIVVTESTGLEPDVARPAEVAEVVEAVPAPETAPRQISGDIHFPAPEAWQVDLWLRLDFDLQEVDPNTHEADGFFNWEIFNFAERDWKRVKSHVEYALFDEAEEAAVVVAQIDEKTGWGEGEPGEWACFWVHDGDLAGDMADQFGIHYYSDFHPEVGFKEFWPEDELPPMAYALPGLPIDVALGDLVIEPAGGTVPAPSEVVSQAETVQAESSTRNLKGEFQFPSPAAWPVDLWITFEVDIHQLDPETHEADGVVNWGVYYFEHDEWKRIKSDVEYVFFDEGGKAAVFVTQITEKTGPGEGEPGEHACYWVRDGELGDQFGIHYYSDFHPEVGFKEFWPEDELPELAYTEPQLPIDVELGDLVVVR
jgi:hypothetical protein